MWLSVEAAEARLAMLEKRAELAEWIMELVANWDDDDTQLGNHVRKHTYGYLPR